MTWQLVPSGRRQRSAFVAAVLLLATILLWRHPDVQPYPPEPALETTSDEEASYTPPESSILDWEDVAYPPQPDWLERRPLPELATEDDEVPAQDDPIVTSSEPLSLSFDTGPESEFCKDRFSTRLIDDFRQYQAQYCAAGSASELTCFHTINTGSFMAGAVDSFCMAQNAVAFDTKKQKFVVQDCPVRRLSTEELASGRVVQLQQINSYQYLTGPKFLLKEWVDIQEHTKLQGAVNWFKDKAHQSPAEGRRFVILHKREVLYGNLWHDLNQLMAIMITLDVLQLSPEDVQNTEIILMDEYADGPFFDLVQMFSGKPALRLSEWVANQTALSGKANMETLLPVDNLILPYAGAANALWSDWGPTINCNHNILLRDFVRRIFDFYQIPRTRRLPSKAEAGLINTILNPAPRLNVTVILRAGGASRKLMGLDSFLLDEMKSKFGHLADINLIDFAEYPFHEQIAIARDTDVLVGMHGAGLTHIMFMEEDKGAVVEIQPDRLCHKGFRNLAKMTGKAYFIAGANKIMGDCYAPIGAGGGKLEMVPDDGTALPSSWETSRCWSETNNPEDWSFACSDPAETGGEKSYMVCRNRKASDAWYNTCTKKEAPDMHWLTRYVMAQDTFLELVERAIKTVQQQKQAQEQLDRFHE